MSIDRARRTLRLEAEAIAGLAERVGEDFLRALDLIMACSGKVIVLGIGKSGLVGRKIAATLASTGTPSFFVHPAEGVHGDLGMIAKNDAVLIVSKSGETEELIRILPAIKRLGLPLIGLLGKTDSTLGRAADAAIDVSVKAEACPLNLAPTASATATMAMGDALALALLERRGFNQDDFARLHPAGTLGKRLLLRVSDLMRSGPALPRVAPGASFKEVIYEISSKLLGHAAVVDGERLVGVISDGDLRRAMEKPGVFERTAEELMTPGGKRIAPSELAEAALRLMERHAITALLVCDNDADQRLLGIIHLHDLLKAGVA